jgi:5-oxoprolinase (ATP-hydrolysing) subunit A
MNRILLNCDMGEGFGAWRMGDDALAMPLIDQANLACGFHAGDPLIMARSVALAVEHGVRIGAHPSYPDLQGFGRRHLQCSPEEVHALVLYQIGALDAFCRAAGGQLAYVKPHGALYNDLVRDDALLAAVLDACASYRKGLPLMVLALADNQRELCLADEADVPLMFEAFADRAYLADGSWRRAGSAARCTRTPNASSPRPWPSPAARPSPTSTANRCGCAPTVSACTATTPSRWPCYGVCGRSWTPSEGAVPAFAALPGRATGQRMRGGSRHLPRAVRGWLLQAPPQAKKDP